MTPEMFRARGAMYRLKNALAALEEELKHFDAELSAEARFELQMLGVTARSFFAMCNQEIFSQQKESVFNGK